MVNVGNDGDVSNVVCHGDKVIVSYQLIIVLEGTRRLLDFEEIAITNYQPEPLMRPRRL